MMERLRSSYLAYGWLIPCTLPVAQFAGRAVFNILTVLFLLWSLAALGGQRFKVDLKTLGLYGLVIAAFLVSAPFAVSSGDAFGTWFRYTVFSLSWLFVLFALQQSPDNLERFTRAWALWALLLCLLLAGHWLWKSMGPIFNPIGEMKEDNLPFLLPFMLFFLKSRFRLKTYLGLASLIVIFCLAYIFVSQGRAALLAFIVSMTAYVILVHRWSWRRVLLLITAISILAVPLTVMRLADLPGRVDNRGIAERLTSSRSIIWAQALKSPPEQFLIGVGMDNLRYQQEVVTGPGWDPDGPPSTTNWRVHHLHNFILDAWYETGLLGAGALLAFLSWIGLRAWQTRPKLDINTQESQGVLFSAGLALITAGLFSFSYTSKQLSLYLFVLIGAIALLSRRAAEASSP